MSDTPRISSGPALDERPAHENPPAKPEVCACGHPVAGHDRIAARYCAATIAGSIERACLCVAAAVTSPRY